eukprot:235255_1
MGVNSAKCCTQTIACTESSYTYSGPEGHTATRRKHMRKDTDEFVSQYGSYFSSTGSTSTSMATSTASMSSSEDSQSTHTRSTSYSSSSSYTGSTSTYSDSESTGTVRHVRVNSHEYSKSVHVIDSCDNGKCQVAQCCALNRIIKALQWHAAFRNSHTAIKNTCEMDESYTVHVMDDYQHVLMDHLFEMDAIRARVNRYVTLCQPNTCAAYKQYNELCAKDLSKCDEKQFFVNIMDLVHSYILHSNCSTK